MTVCVALCCKDGLVMGSDSLTTFGRGAPVSRYTNKVHVIKHTDLAHDVCVAGAGASTFIDKFIDRAKREAIGTAFKAVKRKLDIRDFVERVCEPVVSILLKEYALDRASFFGTPMTEFSLGMLVGGAATDSKGDLEELRAYTVYQEGISEIVDGYGTIGSGAAYAELFLHGFAPEPHNIPLKDGINLLSYTIKGVEIMDPNVGGESSICTLTLAGKKFSIDRVQQRALPKNSKETMEKVLKKIGADMRKIVR